MFAFEILSRAAVAFEILDIRGRRIRTVESSETAAGSYILGWDGRDHGQQQVADGVYFAQLRVRGPGVNETVTRKVTVVR